MTIKRYQYISTIKKHSQTHTPSTSLVKKPASKMETQLTDWKYRTH